MPLLVGYAIPTKAKNLESDLLIWLDLGRLRRISPLFSNGNPMPGATLIPTP